MPGAGEGGMGVSIYWGQSFSWEDEKVLEMAGGDGCTTMGINLMPQSCMLKSGYNGRFYVMLKKSSYM